jgi:Ca2+-transporting ATPase
MKLQEFFELYSSTSEGLSQPQIEINKNKFGENILKTKKRESFFHILLVQFGSFFSIVLMSAATILLILNEIIEFSVILFIVFINVIIEAIQRYKSDSIFESITESIPSFSIVLREGKTKKINSTELVVGDIVILNMGDKVPADGIIIKDENFMIDESILTGESRPVLKKISDEYNISSIIDNPHSVFSGTLVTTGSAKILITSVGNQTQLGMIAQKITTIDTQLPIYKNIKKLSHILFLFIISFAVITFSIGIFYGQTWIDLFKVAVALCVSAIPESMPVTITLILAYGFKRMSEKNVLVKKMQSLDVLGQIQILALDKTGTITRNQMKVEKVSTLLGEELYVTGDGYNPKGSFIYNNQNVNPTHFKSIINLVTHACLAANGSYIFDDSKKEWIMETGDPTEVSLLVLAEKANILKRDLLKEYKLLEKTSFTNQNMYHSATYQKGKEKITVYTGAPEVILNMSSYVQSGELEVKKINSTHQDIFNKKMKEYTSVGHRVLATCIQQGNKFIFQGLFAINDSIRLDVFESVKAVISRGIGIVIITGDHKDIAYQVATNIGIPITIHDVITGEDIANLTDIQLENTLPQKKVFSRVTPQQKLKILEIFKKTGHVIAMTGDGVNDALALVRADLGIAMGTLSSEAAKEAADIVLLDNKFGSIVYGIEEGKNIFTNIKNTILFLLSTNFAEMFVVVFAITLALPAPLSPIGILWVNFVTDTFLVLGFAFERGQIKDQRNNTFLQKRDWGRIIYLGMIMTMISLFVFISQMENGLIHAQTMTLFVLVFMQWFNILNIRSGDESIFKYTFKNNYAFLIGWGISATLTYLAFNNESLRAILKIDQISLMNLVYILSLATCVIWFEEIRKFTRKVLLIRK